MPRIGLTMRVAEAADYTECRDALARDWAAWFQGPFIGLVPCPVLGVGAEAANWAQHLELDALILTGGGTPGDDPGRDSTEIALLDWAARETRPVLGICRGFQVMQTQLGGRLVPVPGHVGTDHPLTGDMKRDRVNSFHSAGIRHPAPGLQPLAMALDGSVEAAAACDRRWLGLMWHPERCRPPDSDDVALMKSHLGLVS